jgi:ABC-2 type transport system ATP-binding protein
VTPDPAIEVVDLSKRYAGRAVVDDLSFRVERGEIVALLGPNGAGKTTTVEMIEGYRSPDAGTIRLLGSDPARGGRDLRARVGLMLQGGGGIEPRLTGREVVRLYARFHADPVDPDAILRTVGLDDRAADTRYRRLSGGERQRVGLAVALVGRPELAILDEPAAGMDVEARAATRELLGRLRDDGVAILVTSHDLVDIERLADRIAIIDRGRLVAFGSPAQLTAGARDVVRFRLHAPLADDDLAGIGAALSDPSNAAASRLEVIADPEAGWHRISGVAPGPDVVARLAAWAADRSLLILELRAGGASIEDRYLELVGAAARAEVAAPTGRPT